MVLTGHGAKHTGERMSHPHGGGGGVGKGEDCRE